MIHSGPQAQLLTENDFIKYVIWPGRHHTNLSVSRLNPPRLSVLNIWIFLSMVSIFYMVATSHLWLLKFKLIEIKSNLKLISLLSLQVPHFKYSIATCGQWLLCWTAQIYKTLPSLPKVLLDSNAKFSTTNIKIIILWCWNLPSQPLTNGFINLFQDDISSFFHESEIW